MQDYNICLPEPKTKYVISESVNSQTETGKFCMFFCFTRNENIPEPVIVKFNLLSKS